MLENDEVCLDNIQVQLCWYQESAASCIDALGFFSEADLTLSCTLSSCAFFKALQSHQQDTQAPGRTL